MSIGKTLLSTVFVSVLTTGCAGSPDTKPRPVEIAVDFNKPSTDWTGGHSDYESGTQPDDVIVAARPLPVPFQGYGLYTAGTNRSDDLFIYIKRKFSGFIPNQDYFLTFRVTFLTDAPAGCVGVGGPPGEAVFLKAGATATEPVTVIVDGRYQMNIDKGNQAQGGADALTLGNIAGTNTDCNQPKFEPKTLTSSTRLRARSDAGGALWLMFGIGSGFEAASEVYYRYATVTASPVRSSRMN